MTANDDVSAVPGRTHGTDVLVFGAGPAGIAATTALVDAGLDVLLVDTGKPILSRDRNDPQDLITGVGGAGPFSDGKFSWYPSATALWLLDDTQVLRQGYRWLTRNLSGLLAVPPFPESLTSRASEHVKAMGHVIEKKYDSAMLDLDTRLKLISELVEPLSSTLRLGWTVNSIQGDSGDLTAHISDTDGNLHVISARALVAAGGRFGNLSSSLERVAPHAFRRYEVGVRLEMLDDQFFLQQHDNLDPKFIWTDRDPDIEWRTFCTCRNGEVIGTSFHGLMSYSGRSDGPPTAVSNVGLNLRLKSEPKPDSPFRAEIDSLLAGAVGPFRTTLDEFLQDGMKWIGPQIDALLRSGLRRLPLRAQENVAVVGPTIEGTGYYPVLDGDLRVPGQKIWFAGDHTGIFRGLTAAFLSGYYAGTKAADDLT